MDTHTFTFANNEWFITVMTDEGARFANSIEQDAEGYYYEDQQGAKVYLHTLFPWVPPHLAA